MRTLLRAFREGRKGDPAGFTLLEVFIAITLLGLLIVIVAGSMRLGYRSLGRGEVKIETLERLKASFMIIDSQVQSTVLPVDPVEGYDISFRGSKDSLAFSSNCSLAGGRRGFVAVVYSVVRYGGNKMALYARENAVGIGGGKDVKLLEGFDEIYFGYFMKEKAGNKEEWVDSWGDGKPLPQKVRVTLMRPGENITLIVPVRAHKEGM